MLTDGIVLVDTLVVVVVIVVVVNVVFGTPAILLILAEDIHGVELHGPYDIKL